MIRRHFLWIATALIAVWPASTWTQLNNQNNGRLFRENLHRLHSVGMCGIPRPRVFYVDEHAEMDATLTYHPSATVLHVCDPSGGCCRDRRKQCSPIEESVVSVIFFVHSVGDRQVNATTHRSSFTSLQFVNHTRCFCTDINDVPRR